MYLMWLDTLLTVGGRRSQGVTPPLFGVHRLGVVKPSEFKKASLQPRLKPLWKPHASSRFTAYATNVDPARKYTTADSKKFYCSKCNFCGKVTYGGFLRVKQHLVGGFQIVTLCPKVPDHVNEEVKTFIINKADAKAALQMQQPAFDYDDEVEEPNIFGVCDKEFRDNACSAIAKWFYDAAIPFNEALDLVVQYGFGFKPPKWVAKGYSILSDEWHDSVIQKDIINFLVNSPRGSVLLKSLLKSVDFSEAGKDSNFLFNMIDRMVDEVGEATVVQVLTDNASIYVKVDMFISVNFLWKLLMAKRPHIYWLPCATRRIDLMLEDIRKIPSIKTTIRRCIFMNDYTMVIYL
ncbi:hypothetical protein Bca4012_065850 [Brassica carinata]